MIKTEQKNVFREKCFSQVFMTTNSRIECLMRVAEDWNLNEICMEGHQITSKEPDVRF